MKPIEQGCLALVVKSVAGNVGKTVRVGHYVGTLEGMHSSYKNLWSVSPPLQSTEGTYLPLADESMLMRIDDMDFDTEVEQELCEIMEKAQ